MKTIQYIFSLLSSRYNYIFGIIILIASFFIARIISDIFQALLKKRVGGHYSKIIKNFVYYVVVIIVFLFIIKDVLHLNLTSIIATLGVLGIAIGFAAQTSFSNIISGWFLLFERSFQVGDVVTIGDKTGEVLSIDLISVKIRTLDNLLLRIPNESILKSNIINITHFPVRRFSLSISIRYSDDIEKAISILKEVAQNDNDVLTNPEPMVMIEKFGADGIELLLLSWCFKTDFKAIKNSLPIAVKKAFDANEIEIPFPQRTIHVQPPSTNNSLL